MSVDEILARLLDNSSLTPHNLIQQRREKMGRVDEILDELICLGRVTVSSTLIKQQIAESKQAIKDEVIKAVEDLCGRPPIDGRMLISTINELFK